MAKIIWDLPTKRTYEHGVDRGVLFSTYYRGVAWNGLTKISVGSSGGKVTPYFQDGIPYMLDASLPSFQGTLEAFTYPPEFEVFSGTATTTQGLTYHNQPVASYFHLVWRTFKGDALNGTASYQIHILYNLLAEPKMDTYATDTKDPTLESLVWNLYSVPQFSDVAFPTSYVSLDSGKISAGIMASIENVIYGSTLRNPRLPTMQQLDDILSGDNSHELTLNKDTGLSNLTLFSGNDLQGSAAEGLFTIPSYSDIKPSNPDGFFQIG